MVGLLKSIVFVVALAGCAGCSPSGAEAQQRSAVSEVSDVKANWTVDKSASSISFTGSMSGDAFTGNFSEFDARIRFDPENLDDAFIHVSIDMASVDANDEERNDALPGKEWFGVKTIPKAVFESTGINRLGDNKYEAIGALTLRDVTQPLTLPFTLEIEDGVAKATGQVSIIRTDFGVGTGMWKSEDWVAHKVDINIEVTANRK